MPCKSSLLHEGAYLPCELDRGHPDDHRHESYRWIDGRVVVVTVSWEYLD